MAALYFAYTTLCAICNFGWREPMFDQWAEYGNFIGHDFPSNVIQEVNGHRPVIPNIIRVAEIHWLAANQILQLTVGALAAYLIAFVLAGISLRERTLPPVARYAAAMLAILGVLWLGNARRLLHGSEALHGYLPTLGALCASYCCYLSKERNSLAWLATACIACVLATFSFGLGLASFCAVFALHLILRLPWRWLILPVGSFALCVLLYVFILPGHSVSGQLAIEPLENIRLTAQWLASPWVNGLLNNAETGSYSVVDLGTRLGRILDTLAKAIHALLSGLGMEVSGLVFLLGFAGIVAFATMALIAIFRKPQISRLSALAFGMCAFAFASGAITVVSRLEYLHMHPEQIYADRYLAWPSLFWSSLAILLLIAATKQKSSFLRGAGLVFLIALPIGLSATQRTGAIWGSIVYRIAEQTAAQVRSGVYDKEHFPGIEQDTATELDNIHRLRDAHVAMFADPAWQRVGTTWMGTMELNREYQVEAHWVDPIKDPTSEKPAGHMEGAVMHGISDISQGGQLVLLDENQIVAGLASFSFIGKGADALGLSVQRKRGFDGYVRDYDPQKTYTLALLDFAKNSGTMLVTLPPTKISLSND